MKSIFHKYKGLLPLIVLLGFCINNVAIARLPLIAENTYVVLNYKHYLAIIFVIASLITFFTYRKLYKYFLLTTLVSGTFELINFVPNRASFSNISFHITPVLVGLFTMLLYLERFKRKPTDSSGQEFEKIDVNHEAILKSEIENFKLKFKNHSAETLTEICSDKRYSLVAKEAAKQVLEERQTKN
ncbi:MAG: hypothetical protein K0S32_627 [Bacteroidetes bacterium]|jgi:hypothetical protein|nr:hypothetical protein [Bacteroidota bacterium]